MDGAYAEADTPLLDGAVLACIPPVSGGSGEDAHRERQRRILELTEGPFEASILDDLAARVATVEDGAVVGFLGRTRATPGTPAPGEEVEAARHAGRRVEALDYEAYEPLALRVLGEIADEVSARFGVQGLAIVHRSGRVALGEPSIAIVAAAPHRVAAFAAASYAIDETKARAPIWKAEVFTDGHVWIGSPARTGPTDPGAATATDGLDHGAGAAGRLGWADEANAGVPSAPTGDESGAPAPEAPRIDPGSP